MRTVETPLAPAPGGHYSQAVIHNGTVYVAGQLPMDPADRNAPAGDAAAQTRRAMEAEIMGDHRPARAVVPVRDLHFGYLIEIQAILAVGEDRS